jgi:hypothetical protein
MHYSANITSLVSGHAFSNSVTSHAACSVDTAFSQFRHRGKMIP